jgi:hypothetical protein
VTPFLGNIIFVIIVKIPFFEKVLTDVGSNFTLNLNSSRPELYGGL